MRQNHYAVKQIDHPSQSQTGGTIKSVTMKISLWRFSYAVLTTFCLLGLTGASSPGSKAKDVELRIGIVQRFGDKPTEQLQLEPTKGDRLKLKFTTNKTEQTLVTTNPVKLETVMQPLPQPIVEEKVVLGTFRTFETAEDNAQSWRKKGIQVEIAQPERWQVWAKRDVYKTPLLRRLLLQSVQKNTKTTTVFIDTQIIKQVPRVSWVVNGNRYSPTKLEISTEKNLIRVNEGKKPDNARLYPGRLELQSNAYGTYTLVNEVPLETYLRGVVPYEIGNSAPVASLEAQAILARTYVLRNVRRFEVDGYQLCADTHCQVYYGLNDVSPATDKAIASTRGMVLTYNNQLVDALYSSTTGGVTASFSDVWNGDDRPYLRPVLDAAVNFWSLSDESLASEENFQRFINRKEGFNESDRELFRWRKESSLQDITKGLQKFLTVKKSPFAKFKTIKEMTVVERSKSGRILKLNVKTDIGTFSLYKDEVRSAFAAPRSTLFYLQPLSKGESKLWGYAFIGGGLGHGVGLSQTGAQSLAKLGWASAKILQFYYPDTQIQILSNNIKP
ncbi:SpoIID/LytB domain-containing protein [Hassallia byssoidea VB512170]|uniref:SpoIID/LytB domain-containing protein n=1 Tax=Hassallia byssoidea VB512170 TaxID=1304833 RepID=A0A846H8M0_9CYAN|nr:SpoIID/LytB domain-containing protein [Hassalia byssoidea]NEU73423.1 SpoIID/LytB domain-containing protein [Hassalia byssoidea VB512170]